MTFRCLLMLIALILGGPAVAQEEAGEGDAAAETGEETPEGEAAEGEGELSVAVNAGNIYIPLKPEFVVNYGGAGRLRYLKADIAVRLADSKVAN